MDLKQLARVLWPAIPACLLALAPAACPGNPYDSSCSKYGEILEETLATRGILEPYVPEVEPFPMAVAFTEAAVNELLSSALDPDGNKDQDFEIDAGGGPFSVRFVPIKDPVITFEHHAGCINCLKIDLDFFTDISFGELGLLYGEGDMRIGVPLTIQRQNEVSFLVADFNNVQLPSEELFLELTAPNSEDVDAAKINVDEYQAVKNYMIDTITDQLAGGFGEATMLEMRPWTIGSENVVLAARKVFVNPDERTLVIGTATNLQIPPGVGLDTKIALTENDYMTVRFHAELLEKMSQRMLEEGEIPRRYNDNGEPDENGAITVTIEAMETDANSNARVETSFRVWRTDDQYCGWADAEMPLFMELGEGGQIGVRAGDLAVTGGRGFGAIAATDEELVSENQEVVEVFKAELAEQVALTVDYKAFDTPNDVFQLFTTGVVSTDEGIEVGLRTLSSLVP